jgi:hypothetical protein
MPHASCLIFVCPLIIRTYSSIGDGCPEGKNKTASSWRTLECLRYVWIEKRIMTLRPSLAECGVLEAEVDDNVRRIFLQRCQWTDKVSLKFPSSSSSPSTFHGTCCEPKEQEIGSRYRSECLRNEWMEEQIASTQCAKQAATECEGSPWNYLLLEVSGLR